MVRLVLVLVARKVVVPPKKELRLHPATTIYAPSVQAEPGNGKISVSQANSYRP